MVAALVAGGPVLPTVATAGPAYTVVRAARAQAGLPPLAEHGGLDGVAARHAATMAAQGSLHHLPGLADAVARVVPDWTRVGQNVGVGPSVDAVESGLLASPQHRANILGDFTLIGTGAATGGDGRVWVAQMFAKTAAAPAPAPAAAAPSPVTAAPAPAAAPPPPPVRASRAAPARPCGPPPPPARRRCGPRRRRIPGPVWPPGGSWPPPRPRRAGGGSPPGGATGWPAPTAACSPTAGSRRSPRWPTGR
ncbi:MAG: CAP domain-containing protein [Acidimicrobiia bacterium]